MRTSEPADPPQFHWLACFCIAYLAAAWLGQGLKLIPLVSITFWPPSGIFVAALLLTRRAAWPWWIAVACLSELIGNVIWFHNPLHRALLYFAANAGEAVTAALLVRRFIARGDSVFDPRRLASPNATLLFLLLAGGVAPIVGATGIAAIDHFAGKHEFWTAWRLVWLGDGTGLLLSAPLTLAAAQAWRHRRQIAWRPALEFAALCAITVFLTNLAVRGRLPTVYLALPAILWVAVRFQIVGAWIALSAVILTIAASTRSGVGEFAGTPDQMHDRLVRLQLFLGVSAFSALIVAGLSSLHVRARERLRIANALLERRVLDRTAALAESEERLRRAMDAANAGSWKVNLDSGEFFASERALLLHGLPAGSAMTHDRAMACVHPDDRDRVLSEVRHAFQSRGRLSVEHRVLKPDGTVAWVSSQADFHSEPGGNWFVGFVQDLTQRKNAEERVARSEHRYRTLVHATGAVTWSCPPSGLQVQPQPEWMAFTGQTAEEMLGEGWTRAVHSDDVPAMIAKWSEAIRLDRPYTHQFRVRRHDGQWRWMNVQAAPVHDEAGRVVEWFGMSIDVTERLQMEAALREHRDNLQQLVEARTNELMVAHQRVATQERMAAVGTLAAGLAHDMNNLLLPLGLRLDDLSAGHADSSDNPAPEISEEVRQELLVLSALLDHLRALAKNLTLFSRDPSKDGAEGRTHLGRWCQQVGKLIDASIGSSIRVQWDCPDGLPEANIAPHRLTQAVQNLIHNARDAILARAESDPAAPRARHKGTVSITAKSSDDARSILLIVSDDGVGMTEEVIRHCREPFFTTKDRPTAVGAGSGSSGLGLSLAHSLIERVGGEMLIDSAPGVGTRITLRLQVAPPAPAMLEMKPDVSSAATPANEKR